MLRAIERALRQAGAEITSHGGQRIRDSQYGRA